MTGINTGKVIAGGLVAGLVANVVDFVTNNYVLKSDWEALAAAHNLDPAAFTSPTVAVTWVVVDFIFGILLVWTYAAIRPRLGPGPTTAIYAGMVIYVATTLVMCGFTMMGVFTMGPFIKGSIAAIVSVVAASVAGASVYKEA